LCMLWVTRYRLSSKEKLVSNQLLEGSGIQGRNPRSGRAQAVENGPCLAYIHHISNTWVNTEGGLST
ncbi:uncharacterized, partial [Tachysurus ichikawai]